MTRTMTIMNEGNSEYYYSFDAEYISGSQELYEQFELTVTGGEGLLFEGSLAEFTELEPRFLNAGTEEELQFVAEFPFESGNEFQGLEVQFKFVLNAQAEESSLPGGPGSVLPETATLSYMFLFFGLSLFGIGGVLYVINKRLDSPRTFKNIT